MKGEPGDTGATGATGATGPLSMQSPVINCDGPVGKCFILPIFYTLSSTLIATLRRLHQFQATLIIVGSETMPPLSSVRDVDVNSCAVNCLQSKSRVAK